MKIFSDLGEAIERRWCALDYDEAKLPRIAEEALRRFVPTRVASAESIVRWLLEAPQVPAQHADASFGDPPVMVFRGTRFFIEVLFWLDGRTAIHQHGFSGAFMVLGGSSIHTHYRFEPSKKVNSSIQVGALRRTKVELLRKGDIRQILAGNRLIHATFHLERPTLTIVVRTPSESTGTPQYHYLPPAIATVGSRDIPTRLDRQLKILATLRQCGSKAFATSAAIFSAEPTTLAQRCCFNVTTKSCVSGHQRS